MNQKGISTLVIAVIVVVVVAVVGVGVYLAMSNTGGSGGNGDTTPDIEGATSLQFSVEVTSEGTSWGTNTYMAKNIGTSDMMIRIEIESSDGDFVYIVNGAEEEAWAYADGEWTDVSDTFSDQWASWNSTWQGYQDSLTDWTGTGEWTYTDTDGSSVRIFDIAVNPTLADSLFQPT
jgi:hypothetical protein